MKKLKNINGFTILELMIATMIFSVILLLMAFGLVKIGQIYYKGITSSRTQNVARNASDDVVQAVQYGGNTVGNTPAAVIGQQDSIIVGNRKYTYVIGKKLVDRAPVATANETDVALKVETLDTDLITVKPNSSRELLSTGMWLSEFKVSGTSPTEITIKVVNGDFDLVEDSSGRLFGDPTGFDIASSKCKSGAGSQFCAVSGLYTKAYKRL